MSDIKHVFKINFLVLTVIWIIFLQFSIGQSSNFPDLNIFVCFLKNKKIKICKTNCDKNLIENSKYLCVYKPFELSAIERPEKRNNTYVNFDSFSVTVIVKRPFPLRLTIDNTISTLSALSRACRENTSLDVSQRCVSWNTRTVWGESLSLRE